MNEPDVRARLPRRDLVKAAGALLFTVGGASVALTPRQARAAAVPLQVLTPAEQRTLEAFGEVLLPGATAAGLAHYVDNQLAAAPGDCLLTVRLADSILPPYADYYHVMLAAIDGSSRALWGMGFEALSAEQRTGYVASLTRQTPWGWQGRVSAAAAFFTVRNDCLDVVYGTEEGFASLGVPYLAHIRPGKLA